MYFANIQSTLSKIKEKPNTAIAIVGDSILDKYVFTSPRLSIKAPPKYPILTIDTTHYALGAAGNVALNIKKMNTEVYYFSVLGEDLYSKIFTEQLIAHGICDLHTVIDSSRRMSIKTSFLCNRQLILRTDEDFKEDITPKLRMNLYYNLKKIIPRLKVLIISNYYKGCLTEDFISDIRKLCHEHHIKLFMDCNQHHNFQGVYLLKPNLSEFQAMTGHTKFRNLRDLIQTGIAFKINNGIKNLLITMDKSGAILFNENNTYIKIPAVQKKIVDSCGAGDTMLAILAVCCIHNIPLSQALPLASYASFICCNNLGTYAVSLDDIENYIRSYKKNHDANTKTNQTIPPS